MLNLLSNINFVNTLISKSVRHLLFLEGHMNRTSMVKQDIKLRMASHALMSMG